MSLHADGPPPPASEDRPAPEGEVLEPMTGIAFPANAAHGEVAALHQVLQQIAARCAERLRRSHIPEDALAGYLSSYGDAVATFDLSKAADHGPVDFLNHMAEAESFREGLETAAWVRQVQSRLRSDKFEIMSEWSFGALPGLPSSLYERFPALRRICLLLGCPAMLQNDGAIVHVASINPVALQVAAAWIRHEISLNAEAHPPFIFCFLIESQIWKNLFNRHFNP